MTLYLIGIGGSGAKCIESAIHLAGTGLYASTSGNQEIKVLFIDPDTSNGTLSRVRETLRTYEKCYSALNTRRERSNKRLWMRTKISPAASDGVWSPLESVGKSQTLANLFEASRLARSSPEIANLFDVLYSQDEQNTELSAGFRGRPAIGSAVMSEMARSQAQEANAWKKLISEIQKDAKTTKPKVCICGSLFGGTGASGIPTIGALLRNELDEASQNVEIASVFLLPYFGFSTSGTDDIGIYADSRNFLLNTEAALNYYDSQSLKMRDIFDVVYLLGGRELSEVSFSIGLSSQNNAPHYLELYAGLAIQNFLSTTGFNKAEPIRTIGTNSINSITWADLSSSKLVKKNLVDTTIFAYAWLSYVLSEINDARSKGMKFAQKTIPWITLFFGRDFGTLATTSLKILKGISGKEAKLPSIEDASVQELEYLTSWCLSYLEWLLSIHKSSDNQTMSVELFRTEHIERILDYHLVNGARRTPKPVNVSPRYEEWSDDLAEFSTTVSDIVFGDSAKKGIILNLKEELNSATKKDVLESGGVGVTGVAKFLYSLLSEA